MIFVTLFWLRQIFNALLVTWNAYTNDELGNGDEMRLSVLFRMHPLALNIISALLGTIVFCIVLFKFIPLRNRFTFLIAGISGGIIGYYLWFDQLGPVVLP